MTTEMELPRGWRLTQTAGYAPTLWQQGTRAAYFPWQPGDGPNGGRFTAYDLPGSGTLVVPPSSDLEAVVMAAIRVLTSREYLSAREHRARNAAQWAGRLEAAGVTVTPAEVEMRYEDVQDWAEGHLNLHGPGGLLERNGWIATADR